MKVQEIFAKTLGVRGSIVVFTGADLGSTDVGGVTWREAKWDPKK